MLGVPSPSGARFSTLSEGAPSTISALLPLRPPLTLTFAPPVPGLSALTRLPCTPAPVPSNCVKFRVASGVPVICRCSTTWPSVACSLCSSGDGFGYGQRLRHRPDREFQIEMHDVGGVDDHAFAHQLFEALLFRRSPCRLPDRSSRNCARPALSAIEREVARPCLC